MKNTVDVFWRFLLLGCISFGGPAAHIGYFHKAFVEKLQWLDDRQFAQLLSLSQFLPGPGSSQLGFSIGLHRAGLLGGIAAFIGFTLPSFIILYLVATLSLDLNSATDMGRLFNGAIHGFKLLAVVVVADACIGMYKKFCMTKLSASLAVFTALALWLAPSFMTQIGVLIFAAIIGICWGNKAAEIQQQPGKLAIAPLLIFIALFALLPLFASSHQTVDLLSQFYHSGSLVFGGGHVVLPLLQQLLGDSVSTDRFLLGYASAQAIPGPMFSFATFLGAELMQDQTLLGASLATIGIFLPGFLLVLALRDAWQSWLSRPRVQGAVWGVNAAVVGLLIAALYQPVFVSAVQGIHDVALIAVGLLALLVFRLPILYLVLGFALCGMVL